AEKHNSYMDLIQFCVKDPINCFASVLNTYLTRRIQELEQVQDVNMENANFFTPSYDDSKKRDHDDEPDTSVKFRRLV
ncbi:MAG TPA: hypothetical protein VFP93_02255, partial [Gammaproteobacteria bacterium]|nr:hypothetical protein [Gammaproteobacteria bacterium]